MIRRPPRSTRTDTLFPYTTLFRSGPTHSLNWPGSLPQLISCRVNARSASVRVKRTVRFSPFLRLIFSKRSEEHTSELQSLMRISYAVFCLKKKKKNDKKSTTTNDITTIYTNKSNQKVNMTYQ